MRHTIPRHEIILVAGKMKYTCLSRLWSDDTGEDAAEYAVMLAVVLVITLSAVRLIGANANNVFSQVSSAIQ
jgi:Flp pilus assembly pilin Flp